MAQSLIPFAGGNFDEAFVDKPDIALGSTSDFTQFLTPADVADERGGIVMLVRANGVVAAQDAVIIDSVYDAASTTLVTTSAKLGQLVGVARVAAADNEFFWVDVFGKSTVNVLTLAAANTALNSTATGGTLDDDATAGSEVIDGIFLLATNGGSTAAVACHLRFPTIGVTL